MPFPGPRAALCHPSWHWRNNASVPVSSPHPGERFVVTTVTLLTIYSFLLCDLREGKQLWHFHPCGEAMNADVFVFVLNPVYNLVTFQLLFHPLWFLKDLALWFRAEAAQFGPCAVSLMCAMLGQKFHISLGCRLLLSEFHRYCVVDPSIMKWRKLSAYS